MKARNREINIFNMSLLDVLSGALGAFCFMMLVLFPYYKPDAAQGKDQKDIPPVQEGEQVSSQKYNDLVDQLEEARQQLKTTRQELDKKTSTLNMRRPGGIYAYWGTVGHDVDVYLLDTFQPPMPPFDPQKKQSQYRPGDRRIGIEGGPGSEMWIMRDVPAGEYKLYYKLFAQGGNPQPCKIEGLLFHDEGVVTLPPVTLQKEKTGVYVGSVMVNAQYKVTFRPAGSAQN